jgi:hypothetical protein
MLWLRCRAGFSLKSSNSMVTSRLRMFCCACESLSGKELFQHPKCAADSGVQYALSTELPATALTHFTMNFDTD